MGSAPPVAFWSIVVTPSPQVSDGRVCFILKVRPDRMDEYRARHAAVWPEMRDALREAGWRNYSLFLRDDGVLVGYLECDDFAACQTAMQKTEVNSRWQAEMSEFFEIDPAVRPDAAIVPLAEIFHLS
jgi:L-rhamnose mutarotase